MSSYDLETKLVSSWKQELPANRRNAMAPEYFTFWERRFYTLFYNAVTDSRIVKAIYQDYPDIREEQLASLKVLLDEVKKGMENGSKEWFLFLYSFGQMR